jgi:hypothetical protein
MMGILILAEEDLREMLILFFKFLGLGYYLSYFAMSLLVLETIFMDLLLDC